MNNFYIRNMSNSEAMHDPFTSSTRYVAPFLAPSQYLREKQSTSVVPSRDLWQQRLIQMRYGNSLTVPQNESGKSETRQGIEQSQKERALLQLLRSWREGDEQEQRTTWEYLKQALDEDRLSDRKLFP